MKPAQLVVPLLFTTAALAVPTYESSQQVFFNGIQETYNNHKDQLSHYTDGLRLGEHLGEAKTIADKFLSDAQRLILRGKKEMERWAHEGRQYIKQNGLLYELVEDELVSPEYQLRMTEPDLCDKSVKQVSGYLDIEEDKSLFFWYFESRSKPSKDPLVLWLNGGPGCSSSTGLLFELGPCNIANKGANTTNNSFSWNSNANVIFLDQPINVGYSYSTGSTVDTSHASGIDVHAFFVLFFQRFPHLKGRELHIAGESYAGHYIPNIASVLFNEEKKSRDLSIETGINLASLLIGNGLTDPYTQMGSVADYACDGPYPIYDDPNGAECQALRSKVPTCQRLMKTCYNYDSRFTCVPAGLYCNSQLYGPFMQTGLNPYDVRLKCDRSKDGDLCYKELNWVEAYLNDPAVKVKLGVSPEREFASCNMDVNKAFAVKGDGAHNSALLLPELIEAGVRMMIYAGNADFMCNYIGNERWVEELSTSFKSEFASAPSLPFITTGHKVINEDRSVGSAGGKVAGSVRSAGGKGINAGNVTFVTIFEAGHMVPHDQPEAALVRYYLDWS
ncbi:carboxypeptidase C [Pterulicium gracile]|uniref:Carboxypeptidase n=1 Tax=Pterulicium gracile TaxID=1884261 RepID=A0A5C3QGB5_9AGAR|nr:carboxypeptidase C [Pterula gracilis]